MGWICPTFQRPERLAELALSWEKCEPGKKLWVRVWEDDPRKDDYFKYEWPEGWVLYESAAEWAGEALNQYFDMQPNEPYYGFIGDDIVLRTPLGMSELEDEAGEWCIAYPNDMLQRHRLCTHFCIGGEFARTLGYIVPRTFAHHNIDLALMNIGRETGLIRYCPRVIFQHKHFLARRDVERDATYRKVWGDVPLEEISKRNELFDSKVWTAWAHGEFSRDVGKLRRKMLEYEKPEEWEAEDFAMGNLGVADGVV